MTYPLHLDGPVILREFRQTDVDDVLAVVGDDRVTQWLSFDSRDRVGAQRMVDAAVTSAQATPRTEFYLAIEADRSLVGFARLAIGSPTSAKLGYAVHADRQGRGYATAAARLLTAYGFGKLGLHRITAAVGPQNAASQSVLRHLGFTEEGRLRDHVFTNGEWRDSLLYSLLASDPATTI